MRRSRWNLRVLRGNSPPGRGEDFARTLRGLLMNSRNLGFYRYRRIHIMQVLLADAIYSLGFCAPGAFPQLALFLALSYGAEKSREAEMAAGASIFGLPTPRRSFCAPKRPSEAASRPNSRVPTWTPFFRRGFHHPQRVRARSCYTQMTLVCVHACKSVCKGACACASLSVRRVVDDLRTSGSPRHAEQRDDFQ